MSIFINEQKEEFLEKFIFVTEKNDCNIDINEEKTYKLSSNETLVKFDVNDISYLKDKFKSDKIILDFSDITSDNLEDYIADVIYLNDQFKDSKIKDFNIITNQEINLIKIDALLDTFTMIRYLVMSPSDVVNPTAYAEFIKEKMVMDNLEVTFIDQDTIKSQYHGLYAVGRGSLYDSELVKLNLCTDASKPKVTIVGKGVTFDTGGFNIKVGIQNYSKTDMTGSATALGIINYLSKMNEQVNLEVILCITENNNSRDMMLPGEVIKYKNDTTVEVTNTDAEGRLILADGILCALENRPELIIDIATLTGAAGATFGSDFTVVMGNNQNVVNKFMDVKSNEYYWQLPTHQKYLERLKSEVADYTSQAGQDAGTIMAGMFLELFVDGVDWLHFDIAATALSFSGTKPLVPCVTVKPLIDFITKYEC